MAALKEKIKLTLDEARMLVLGVQILIGFEYRSILDTGFDALPASSQHLKIFSLLAELATVALLMWPACFQQITERGECTRDMLAFTTRVMCWALFPFALSLGLDTYTVSRKIWGFYPGIATGAATAALALFFWYGWELIQRHPLAEHPMKEPGETPKPIATPLKDKINDVLTEARVIVPGAQALLGFQFIAMLSEGFDKLPASSKHVHLASLLLMALATILLMTPAAYHRIVERGENTHRFWLHARRMVLASMVPLAAGMSGEFFVVCRKVFGNVTLSVWASIAVLLTFYGAWFGYTLYRRLHLSAHSPSLREPLTSNTAVSQ